MPVLHLTQDGRYCIRGNPHGIGFCTWQVGDNALRYLRDRGVGDGGEVAGSEVKHLLRQRWIWTEGTGPGAEVGRETYVPRVIVDQLVAWARKADLRGLSAALHDGHRDYKAQCFTSTFLTWLADLDPDLTLPDLDDLSEPDFSDLAAGRLGRLEHPLLERCIEQSWMEVPWRLASLLGRVARYVEDEATWPARWDKDYPILKAIYFRVRDFHNREQRGFCTKPIPRRRSIRAVIRWDVDGQQVIAVLLAHRLAHGQETRWAINDVPARKPQIWPTENGVVVREAISDPLDPARRWCVAVTIQPDGQYSEQRFSIGEEAVLFAPDGTLLPQRAGEFHLPGSYLALVQPPVAEKLSAVPGIRVEDTIEFVPHEWACENWRGFRVQLASGATLDTFIIGGTDEPVAWDWPDPPLSVRFGVPAPVWFGTWPQVLITQPASLAEARQEFEGALLEVEVERNDASERIKRKLRVEQNHIRGADAKAHAQLDLQSMRELQDVYGTIRVTCRLLGHPDRPPLSMRLIRLPIAGLSYVDDPKAPGRACAVRIQTDQRVDAGSDGELSVHNGERILRALDAVQSPSATCVFPDFGVELPVRIPVTRLRRVSRSEGNGRWLAPPIELRLAEVGLDDRLRLELHVLAQLENGRLFSRLVGGGEVAAGRACDIPNTYVIDLHRWREELGPDAAGTVQVWSRERWIDIARLQGRPRLHFEEPPLLSTVLGSR